MPLTADLEQLAARVSNWGRWGADDQRGTLNLITPEVVRRGVAAARTGRAFSLAIPFDQTGPQWDNVHMPERTNPELRTHTVNVAFTGDTRDFTTSDDSFRMGSQAVDALGRARARRLRGQALQRHAEHGRARRGRRGAARHRALRPGRDARRAARHRARCTASTTSTTTTRSPATISTRPRPRPASSSKPGDAVLVRTGQMHFLRAGDKQRYSMPSPGLSTQSIEWLRDHDVAAVATDTMTFEVLSRARTRASSCPCT